MTIADRVTASRLFLAPLFYGIFVSCLPGIARIILLWLLFALIELSDLADGQIARRSGQVSAFGKLFDPFADVIARVTYFLCFALSGLMPGWILLVILYREFSILFLRMLLSSKNIVMGARPGGKIKAVLYMASGIAALLYMTISEFDALTGLWSVSYFLAQAFFVVAAILSVVSFVDYWLQFRALYRAAP